MGVVNSYVFSDDIGPALAMVEDSLVISRELGDRFQLGWALFTRGLILNKGGDPSRPPFVRGSARHLPRDGRHDRLRLVLDGLAVWIGARAIASAR